MTRFALPLAMLLAMLLAVLLAMLWPSPPARAEGVPPHPALKEIGVDQRPGQPLPLELPFVDTQGQDRTLGDFVGRGKPVLLVLAYSRCSMLCNVVLRGLAKAVRAMKSRAGQDYTLVTVSIDPDETPDTAARQRAVVAEAAGIAAERWAFLSGEREAIDGLAGALGFRYARDPRSGQIAHPSVVFVLTPEGTVAQYLQGVRYESADVERALAQARAGAIAARGGALEAVLSCFRFDPTRRKYGPLIFGGLQALAVALVAGLGIAGFFLFRKERRS